MGSVEKVMNLLQSSGKFILAHVFILAQELCSTATTFFFSCCIERLVALQRSTLILMYIRLLGYQAYDQHMVDSWKPLRRRFNLVTLIAFQRGKSLI